ncbi:hypothetical protein CO044_01255 [Candidatus Peregrinibacteria bacterium CG_4_9_14_0_2_um_filter_38_9]|nr:MAG: hypothetical protein CO044_01255 [Candidatus Peregrinibacteria bacterium CG_4_9_14_0_2_um_filter_38_9]
MGKGGPDRGTSFSDLALAASEAVAVSNATVDQVLAEIGDLRAVAFLGEDELRMVVKDAVKAVLRHKDPASVEQDSGKKVPKLDDISAKKYSELLNGLKMVMKEGFHYKADEKGFVTLTSSGVVLIAQMKIDIFPGRLEALIGQNLDEFRLGEKMMKVRGMAKGEIGKVFAGRDKKRDAKRSGERAFLGNQERVEFGVEEYPDGAEKFTAKDMARAGGSAEERVEDFDEEAATAEFVQALDAEFADGGVTIEVLDENARRAGRVKFAPTAEA